MRRPAIVAGAALAAILLLVLLFRGAAPGKPRARLSLSPFSAAERAAFEPQLELAEGGGPRKHVLFGRHFFAAPFDFRAAIVVLDGDAARGVVLPDPDFHGHGWVHAARSGDGKTIWAIADNMVESPGWTLELLVSEDAGQTWRHLSSVPKPGYQATFESFRMSKHGRGAITVRLPSEAPADRDGATLAALRALLPGGEPPMHPPGLYVFRTRNGGRTWSRPDHYEDDTEPAWTSEEALEGFLAPEGAGPLLVGTDDGWGAAPASASAGAATQ